MAVLLQLAVELAVQLVDLLGCLLVLDELADQEVGALPYLLVELDPRHPMTNLLERPRPRLGVQVIGVHQRPVHVEHHYLRHFVRPPITSEHTTSYSAQQAHTPHQRLRPEALGYPRMSTPPSGSPAATSSRTCLVSLLVSASRRPRGAPCHPATLSLLSRRPGPLHARQKELI